MPADLDVLLCYNSVLKRTKSIDEHEKVICFFWPFLLIGEFSFPFSFPFSSPLEEQDMVCNNEALLSLHWHVTSSRLNKSAKETLTNLILTLNYHFHSIQRKHSNDMQRVGSLHHNIFSQMFAVCFWFNQKCLVFDVQMYYWLQATKFGCWVPTINIWNIRNCGYARYTVSLYEY